MSSEFTIDPESALSLQDYISEKFAKGNPILLKVRQGLEDGLSRDEIIESFDDSTDKLKALEQFKYMYPVKVSKDKIIEQLREISPVIKMYHVSSNDRQQSINDHGLVPNHPTFGKSGVKPLATVGEVYLFLKKSSADDYLRTKNYGSSGVIYQVKVETSRLMPDLDYASLVEGFKVKGGVELVTKLYKSNIF